MKSYFPIGTVVLLKDANKKLMIIGIAQKQLGTEKIWDYAGCVFPEGYLAPDKVLLFDHEQIEQIYMIGYQDKEQLEFLAKVSAYMQENKKED